jgi:putative membrane protein
MPGSGVGLDGGVGIVAIVWIILVAAFWVLVLAALVLGVRWLIRADRSSRERQEPPPQPPPPDLVAGHGTGPKAEDPLEVLRLRYARGEIDDDEFERRRRTLTGS